MVDENLTNDQPSPETQPPAEPMVQVAPPESRFLFVDVAALRAKQLRRGARPRLQEIPVQAGGAPAVVPRKPERVAMEEVRQGWVPYELPDVKPPVPGDDQ